MMTKQGKHELIEHGQIRREHIDGIVVRVESICQPPRPPRRWWQRRRPAGPPFVTLDIILKVNGVEAIRPNGLPQGIRTGDDITVNVPEIVAELT